MSLRASRSATNRSVWPSGEKTGCFSSSAVARHLARFGNSVSMTHTSPPAMKAISRPSAVNAASLACRSTRRSTRLLDRIAVVADVDLARRLVLTGPITYRSNRWRKTRVEPSRDRHGKTTGIIGEMAKLLALGWRRDRAPRD